MSFELQANGISKHKRKRDDALPMTVIPREFPSIKSWPQNREYFHIYIVKKRVALKTKPVIKMNRSNYVIDKSLVSATQEIRLIRTTIVFYFFFKLQ